MKDCWIEGFPQVREHYEAAGGERPDDVAKELGRFFALTRTTDAPLAMLSPNVDLMWHKFIEFTEEYQPFCEREFGELIHHRPRTAASPVPAQAVRNLYQAYEARFGDLPELWEEGVPPEVIAYARGRSDTLPPNYRWSGWPGRKAA